MAPDFHTVREYKVCILLLVEWWNPTTEPLSTKESITLDCRGQGCTTDWSKRGLAEFSYIITREESVRAVNRLQAHWPVSCQSFFFSFISLWSSSDTHVLAERSVFSECWGWTHCWSLPTLGGSVCDHVKLLHQSLYWQWLVLFHLQIFVLFFRLLASHFYFEINYIDNPWFTFTFFVNQVHPCVYEW